MEQQIIIACIITGVVALAVGFIVCLVVQNARRKSGERRIGRAEEEAKAILSAALQDAEAKKKEAILKAKEEIIAQRNEAENELKERRKEVSRQENRLAQKEENLDNKMANLDRREAALAEKQKKAEELEAEVREVIAKQITALERISGMTSDEAREALLSKIEGEIQHETALKISEYEARFKEESEARARDILSTAIQRCAADHVSEVAISVVSLPSEDMKGRIIGRKSEAKRS